MKTLLVLVLAFAAPHFVSAAPPASRGPFESDAPLKPRNGIDERVLARLTSLNIQPARLCSDAVFLRRTYLDVLGTLPTTQEARLFLDDRSPSKREALIDALLEREEYADYWAMRWSDILRVKSEFPINLWPNAVQAYHRWIRNALKTNMPYDAFARALLTSSGSNFRVPPVNFYRALQSQNPEALAQGVALIFMGERTERWSKERREELTAFFSQVGFKSTGEWKEEIVFFDPGKTNAPPSRGPSRAALLADGTRVERAPDRDPRVVFADWLIQADNPAFARNMANRLWFWLLGRGIVQEPDDFRPDNPPSNPELLNYLEEEFVKSGCDLKQLMRLILNSTTYQLSSIPRSDHPEAARQFAFYPLRRLDAEVLIDALCQITGTTETYSSPIPEPFTFIPENQKSVALADGSISSSFLDMFGRPPRDTGLLSERNNRPTASQRLHLLNSSHVQRKLEQSRKLRSLVPSGRKPREAVNRLYLTILSRYPTPEELGVVGQYAQSSETNPREVAVDLAWALVNSPEFLYRH